MIDRREFIRNGMRSLIIAGLGVMSGVFVYRNYNSENETCNFDFLCRDCSKLSECRLPEGVKFKQMK